MNWALRVVGRERGEYSSWWNGVCTGGGWHLLPRLVNAASLGCWSESFGRIQREALGDRSLIIPNFTLMEKDRHRRVLRKEAARSEVYLRKLTLPARRMCRWQPGAHHSGGRPEVQGQGQEDPGTGERKAWAEAVDLWCGPGRRLVHCSR